MKKKYSSIAWQFFDRIENENRCIAVLCKLCDTQYKFFGNTTNLRVHLKNKHPLQWELALNGSLDDSNFQIEDDESNQSAVSPKRKSYSTRSYKDKNVRYSVSVDNTRNTRERIPKIEIQRIDVLSDVDNDNRDNEDTEATFNLVRQLHEGSDEEWLVDDQYQTTYTPTSKKVLYRKIKREVQTPPRRLPSRPVNYEKSPVVIENTIYRDECSVFGEYVANKLRKLKVSRTRSNLQQLITTILWQAEYGTYDNANTVKRVLMHSVQESELETGTIHPDLDVNVEGEEVIEQPDDIPNQSMEVEG
ncbi:uncharacterized protein LOC131845911 isoform X1 [Achroia grisella]|uniref:uncharacterized protein LOC131845911 isoform X1 n=1 Tax=Achroia grisella TaxID=688607 RepID=UPI0027D267A0|nr:uncharacterized protein LOC131845911 isoform X1 [Achroia grisella]